MIDLDGTRLHVSWDTVTRESRSLFSDIYEMSGQNSSF